MLSVTETAKERIREILDNAPRPTPIMGMRIYTLPVDKDTFVVGFAVERRPGPTDIKVQVGDIRLYIDSSEFKYIRDGKIDFDPAAAEAGFQITFPNKCSGGCTGCIKMGNCGFYDI